MQEPKKREISVMNFLNYLDDTRDARYMQDENSETEMILSYSEWRASQHHKSFS